MLTGGTTFKIISSFAVTHSPTANESPYLRPLFNQIIYLYKMVKLMTADAGYISRENCDVIGTVQFQGFSRRKTSCTGTRGGR